nr:hypothetical protein [Tanacetum cinerariifolium]
MQKTPEECYELIEKMTAQHSYWDTSAIRDETSRNISSTSTTESPKVVRQLEMMNKNFSEMMRQFQMIKAVDTKCKTCGGPHSFTECPAVGGYTQETAYTTMGRGNNFNQAATYQASTHPHQVVPQVSDFQAYMKENDAVMKNMQTQMTSLTNLNLELENMFGQFMKMNTTSSSGTGSLPNNTVPNPREDLKVITTWSGVTLDGPLVSPPPLSKEVDQEPETIMDKVLTESTNNVPLLVVPPSPASTSFSTISSSKMLKVTKDTVQPSIKNIQPLVAQTQIPVYEPVVAPKPKPTIPYPSRVNKQKLREKDNNLALKFVEIFRNLHFELSFAGALFHMPKFALMFKSLLNNKENLFDLATTPVNENCSAVILKKLPEKLRDPGKFLIPCDFLEFDECLALADLGASINLMPLSIWKNLSLPELTSTQMILELVDRSMTRPAGITKDILFERALIDVYGEELTLRVDDEAITFKNGNPTPISDPIVALYSPSLTPFEGGDFILEEIEACLISESIPPGIDDTNLDLEGDIRLQKELLNNDPSLSALPPKELNVEKIKTVKSSIDEPPKLELKELPSHLEYAYLEGTDNLPVIIAKRPMTHLLEKETPFVFSKDCIDAFETPKKKLTEAPILVVLDWNLPFELIILYTDHSALKYLLNKQDAKPRLIRWVLLLQEFDIIIRDKKGTKDLAADHLPRLENPHKDVLENKDINESFPLETLGKISSESTLWFADFANYHAENFIVKGCRPNKRRNSLKTLNTIFGTTPICLRFVLIKSFDGVCMDKKLMISSKLVMKDPPGAIMVPISPLRKYSMPVSFCPLFTGMPMTWSHGVKLVNVKAKFRNVIKCLKVQFKFAKFSTFGASISWDYLSKWVEANIFSWPLIICPNG